jgi:DNA-binding NarL/FixJ family response regulator
VTITEKTARVLIVDDHTVFAESLGHLLGRESGIAVVGHATTAAEAERLTAEHEPDVVLMDHYLPDASGVAASRAILAARPQTQIVMLTGGAAEEDMLDAVEAGVSGYLLKTAPVSLVIDAIRRAAEGEVLLAPAELAGLLRRVRARAKARADMERAATTLTHREREALELMGQALDTRAMAERLGVSFNTARGYAQSVLEKLGARSRLGAVLRATELGLIER